MTDLRIYFVFPGDLATATGGYRYDRRLITELKQLGIGVETVSLPECMFDSNQQFQQSAWQSFAAIPDQSIVIVDGLAFGAMDEVASAEAQRLRLVALCHHPLALETGLDELNRQILFESEKRALSCARAIIVTSEFTRQILADQFAVPTAKTVVAFPGTDPVPYAACQGQPLQLLTVASLTRRKGHDVLVKALAGLSDLSWQARFVGGDHFDPEWAAHLRTLVVDYGLSRCVRFCGEVDDVRSEYLNADVFVLPSRFEGYGMVFAEALAAGLPVIGANAGAVPFVVPVSAGVLVAPDDVDALASALRQIISDGSSRSRLQLGARAAAASLPGWHDCAARVVEKLKEVQSL